VQVVVPHLPTHDAGLVGVVVVVVVVGVVCGGVVVGVVVVANGI
jgi:hypothetical protein